MDSSSLVSGQDLNTEISEAGYFFWSWTGSAFYTAEAWAHCLSYFKLKFGSEIRIYPTYYSFCWGEDFFFWHVSCFYGGPLLLSNPWPLLVTREYTSLSTPLYRPRNLKKLPGFPSMKALRLRKIPSFPCVYYRFMCHLSLYMLWNAFKYTS